MDRQSNYPFRDHREDGLFGASFLRLWFNFDNRISRSTYWLMRVCVHNLLTVCWLLVASMNSHAGLLAKLIWVVWGLLLVMGWYAISVKRWHDLNKSGWWCLIVFIPVAGFISEFIVLGFIRGTPGYNDYGSEP